MNEDTALVQGIYCDINILSISLAHNLNQGTNEKQFLIVEKT